MKFNLVNRVAAAAVVVLASAGAAQAAAVDVAATVTDIGAQMTSIVAVGGAVLVLIVGTKAFKWIRRAL